MKTRDMTLIAMFAALTAAGAFIRIPTPIVPFTLQFLFCAYAGILLGKKKGAYSQILYVVTGLIGIPVFTSGGGPAYIFQPTFGFLLGFIVCAYVIGKHSEKFETLTLKNTLPIILYGLFYVYLFGVTYLYLNVNFYLGKEMSFLHALEVGFIPYIPFDIMISFFVAITSKKIVPILKSSGINV